LQLTFFFLQWNGHVSGSRSRASVTLVDACSLLCFLEREEKKKQVPTINLFCFFLFFCAGVTSFEVDLEKKKVVVIGDVTPYEVLASISKVKFAELWVAPQQPQAASRCGKAPAGGVV
jgi:hypothetical protein